MPVSGFGAESLQFPRVNRCGVMGKIWNAVHQQISRASMASIDKRWLRVGKETSICKCCVFQQISCTVYSSNVATPMSSSPAYPCKMLVGAKKIARPRKSGQGPLVLMTQRQHLT